MMVRVMIKTVPFYARGRGFIRPWIIIPLVLSNDLSGVDRTFSAGEKRRRGAVCTVIVLRRYVESRK